MVSVAVYLITRRGEASEFETQYEGAATKVVESFADIVYEMGAISGLGVANSAHSVDHKSEWPFVTLSNFQQRAGNARHLSGALMVSISPLVQSHQLQEWDDFVNDPANNYWVDEGHAFQKELGLDDFEYAPNVERSSLTNRTVDPMHYFDQNGIPQLEHSTTTNNTTTSTTTIEDDDYQLLVYLPIWQMSPVLHTKHVNENLLRATTITYRNSTHQLQDEGHQAAVAIEEAAAFVGGFALAPAGTTQDTNPTTALFATLMSVAAQREVPYLGDPMANIYIPVYDLFDRSKRKVAAVMTSTIHWRSYFEKILPSNIRGIVVVLENPCDGAFTYEIHGDEALVVGSGDQHDSTFDEWQRDGTFTSSGSTLQDGTSGGILLHNEGCQYTIRVYPSQQFYDEYNTATPVIITMSLIAVFVFTIVVFYMYDSVVEKRQKIVLGKAVQSTVNSSMLRRMVQERAKKLEIANQQLATANQTIREAAARQLQHFACMSHEIRTPLNCVVGMSTLLKDAMQDPEKAESMGMIVTSGELLLRVVDDVLDYSKLESGHVEIDVKKSNLQETLNAVVHAIETKASSTHVSLQTNYGISIGEYFNTDSRRLQQILYNLLGNAIKFSKANGIVELNVELVQRSLSSQVDNPQVSPGCSTGQSLQFIVKDYGKGIEEADFEKIFRPFTQASSETERLYGGTGLGLAITAKLVKALGGTVVVDSKVEEWTKMIVDIPVASNSATADVPALSSQLQNCTAVLLGGSADDISLLGKIFSEYNVAYVPHDSLEEFERALPEQHSRREGNAFVCIINETIYNHDAFNSLMTKNPQSKMTVLTYGPHFLSKEAEGHYRSFSRMLPSVFLKSLGDYVKKAQKTNEACLRRSQILRRSAAASYRDLRVLLAEDNLVNQKVAKRILQRIGISQVTVVENGKLAVEEEATGAFDLILMDIQMPVMDGVEACKLIVDRHQQQGVEFPAKVVFCTAHVLDAFKIKCAEAGCSGFLSKPFRLQDVESFLESLPLPIGRWGLDTTARPNADA